MPRHTPLYEWDQRVATAFPDLPPATARVLADWSSGLVLAHTCGLGTVALTLAAVLGQAVHTARQRVREFYPPADRKAGQGARRWTRPPVAHRSCDGSRPGGPTSGSPWPWTRPTWGIGSTSRRRPSCTGGAHPGRLGRPAGRRHGRVEPALGPAVGSGLGRAPRGGLDGPGPDRPRIGIRRVVPGHRRTRPPSADAGPSPVVVPSRRVADILPLGTFAAREGSRFAAIGTAYRTAPLGCTLPGGRVAGVRTGGWSGPRPPGVVCGPVLVRRAELDRAGVQGHEERRVAMAANPDGAPGSGRAVVGGRGGRDVMAGRGRRSGGTRTASPRRFRRWADGTAAPAHRLFRVGLAVILAGLLSGEVRTGRFQPELWPDPVPIPPITEVMFCSQMTYP